MRTQSPDTSSKIEQLQIIGLRRLTPAQRFQMANRLTRSVFTLSWANFRRKHSSLDEGAAAVLWVRFLYGDDLAERLSAYMERSRRE